MNQIQTVNPEEFLEKTDGVGFAIMFFTSNSRYYFVHANDIVLADQDGMIRSPYINRDNLVKEYYGASNFVKNSPLSEGGGVLLITRLV